MNNTQLYIPQKCKVGLQIRQGTYTGKLGYIIYNDGKVWRKEKSWEDWRHKEGQSTNRWNAEGEKAIGVEPIEFDNVPTEGFVLNKKVGGTNSGWNHRQTYSRVYDPRGWEFEITIPNLLYILQECSSFKGKGLEGEFVYSWDGKDLVLLPVSSPDYVACENFTKLQTGKIGKRDLTEGCTYLTSKMKELVYLGYLNVVTDVWSNKTDIERVVDREKYSEPYVNKKNIFEKKYVFVDTTAKDSRWGKYTFLSGFSSLKAKVSDDIHPKFAELMDDYQKSEWAGIAEHLRVVPLTDEDIERLYSSSHIFKFGEIETVDDYYRLRYYVQKVSVDKYSLSPAPKGWNNNTSWGFGIPQNSGNLNVSHYSIYELKAMFGKIVRVYNNNFIEETD